MLPPLVTPDKRLPLGTAASGGSHLRQPLAAKLLAANEGCRTSGNGDVSACRGELAQLILATPSGYYTNYSSNISCQGSKLAALDMNDVFTIMV